MRVIVTRSDENYRMILEYLHYHLPSSITREFIKCEEETFQPRFIINHPEFVYNEINFTIKTQEVYKKVYEVFYKYTELILEHESLQVIEQFIQTSVIYITKKLYINNKEKKLYIYRSCYERWDLECELKQKSLETFYIPAKIKKEIIQDITKFSDTLTMNRYKELCINHVRMYLFYGPPGTGKTSLIKALATHFNKNIAYLNIQTDLEDSQLKKSIQRIPSNTILCLEDIDALFAEERKSKYSLTFSGFINCFDGFATPDNLMVFITTNYLKQLENAIVRRISYFIEFKFATKEQIQQMFNKFFPNQIENFNVFYQNIKGIDITINILEKFFTKYLFDDIIEASTTFANFANGELKVEINGSTKLYI